MFHHLTLRRALMALVTLALVGGIPGLTGNSVRAQSGGNPPGLTAVKKEFFVVSDQDRQTIVSLVVADELSKFLNNRSKIPLSGFRTDRAPDQIPWIIPQPSWDAVRLAGECSTNPNALGGVVLTYYSGAASHFWLLWQTQTTTFEIFGQIISCNRNLGKVEPVIVGIIAHLADANNTPWIVRRSQISVPLLSIAAIGTVVSKAPTGSNSKTSTLTLTAVAGSLFSSAGTKDVPGYSDPLRLRLSSQHIGVDVATTLRQLCGVPDENGYLPPDGVPFNALPSKLGPLFQLCQDLGVVATSPPAQSGGASGSR